MNIFPFANLFSNIALNFMNVKNDFIGINFNVIGIEKVFACIIFALLSIAAYHFIGEIVLLFLKRPSLKYNFFISIAIGYIIFGTIIAFAGIFSILYPPFLYIMLICLTICGVTSLYRSRKKLHAVLSEAKKYSSKNRYLFFFLLLFIVLSFLRLLLPETAEDSVGYHTDLPALYIQYHSTMLSLAHPQHVITYPQLSEMHYILPIFLGLRDATRYLHFSFVILLLLLIVQFSKNERHNYEYSLLIFITTPLVIKYSSTAYVDFFMIFLWLLGTIIIMTVPKLTTKALLITGFILGGALSIKLWLLGFLPILFIFILQKGEKFKVQIARIILFTLSCLSVPLLWYLRSYILKGSPIYPIMGNPYDVDQIANIAPKISNYLTLNFRMYSLENMILLSPLFFIGVIYVLLKLVFKKEKIKYNKIFIFFLFLTAGYLIFPLSVVRYDLAWYVYGLLVASFAIQELMTTRINKILITIGVFLFFSYYFLNTIFSLPYAFGWSDQNKYLTRILSRDNSSYYDFDRLFDKHFGKDDTVITYGIFGFYYAKFKYIDINNIYKTDKRFFASIKESPASKLLIKGGDFKWFCTKLHINGCEEDKVVLLATYPHDTHKYNLYQIVR